MSLFFILFYENDIHRDLVSVGTVGAAASTDFDDADFTPKILKKVDFESVIFIQNSL